MGHCKNMKVGHHTHKKFWSKCVPPKNKQVGHKRWATTHIENWHYPWHALNMVKFSKNSKKYHYSHYFCSQQYYLPNLEPYIIPKASELWKEQHFTYKGTFPVLSHATDCFFEKSTCYNFPKYGYKVMHFTYQAVIFVFKIYKYNLQEMFCSLPIFSKSWNGKTMLVL